MKPPKKFTSPICLDSIDQLLNIAFSLGYKTGTICIGKKEWDALRWITSHSDESLPGSGEVICSILKRNGYDLIISDKTSFISIEPNMFVVPQLGSDL